MRLDQLKRREFITLLGGAAAWPLAARAQQRTMPVIGFLHPVAPEPLQSRVAALRQGLKDGGFVEGDNVAIEYRWANGDYSRLPALAADLVHRQVAVIFAGGGAVSALAAKAATTTIPIVFANGDDVLKLGLVASMNRPGGNVTGVNFLSNSLEEKRLGLLRALIPAVNIIAVLSNPDNPSSGAQLKSEQEAADKLGVQLLVFGASNESDIDSAFARLVAQRAGALIVNSDGYLSNRREQIISLARRHLIPTIYEFRDAAADGGLLSYGASIVDAWRQAAGYVARILRGEKPADLPVMQPTRFELVINLTTAKALGLDVPPTVLALADEVIE